ncbi:MAG: sodium:proton antiporter [Ignavibacteriales bacterium]|nr:sodium:proton antiporter [Ignavibacteriales bacterium]
MYKNLLSLFLLNIFPTSFLFSQELVPSGEIIQSISPTPWMILPFVLLLLAIALMPFINKHWWEKYYPHVAVGLGCITLFYYIFIFGDSERVVHTSFEYISFIVLIGSLFVVAGGIHIRIKGRSTPMRNVVLLGIGAIVSNFIGTTGASMLLIRPYIRSNKYRISGFHIVFFIFIVSNIGGSLTPIGDPPLFLGYLKGIPFFWVLENVWLEWLLTISLVLLVFYFFDRISFKKLPDAMEHEIEALEEEAEVSGVHNILFLLIILSAVFIQKPMFVRELLMVGAAIGSYFTTRKAIHEKNDFNFHPIKEVAFLFIGIFATMIPALQWLEVNAQSIGITTAGQFYWGTGILSAVLDNAPTYLNFLSASFGLFVKHDVIAQMQLLISQHGADFGAVTQIHSEEIRNTYTVLLKYHYDLLATKNVSVADIQTAFILGNHFIYIKAISLGAVFFGANTYIGNGPNFMVKSIADQNKVDTPNFLEYIYKYSFPILIPVFALVWLLFF